MGHSSPKNAEYKNGSGMDWIPGQARNDVGLVLGDGCLWIPGQARNDVQDIGWESRTYVIPDVTEAAR